MREIINITVQMKPVSVNHYWKMRRGGGRYITPLGSKFKTMVEFLIRGALYKPKDRCLYKLEIELYSQSWVTQKGLPSLSAGDCDNYGKVCCDALFGALKLNDALIWELNIKKVQSDAEFTRLCLFEIS